MSVSTADVAKIIEDAVKERYWPQFLWSEWSEETGGWFVKLAGEFMDFDITIEKVARPTRDEPIELW